MERVLAAGKIRGLRNRQFGELQPMGNELFQKKLEARRMYTDPKVTDETLLAKQKEIGLLQQKIRDKMAQLRIEERRIFTPEQLQKLNEMPSGFGRGYGRGRCLN